ncbi:glycosyltransferase [Vibrio sp. TRT 2004]|uniref:glycosyltransferase n=1 Tax=Vibrio sp. TRT 2004 TaxID=3418506 RepID=UPI003CF8CE94
MKDGLAPIAVFVFNRPDHTRRMLSALKNNNLANDSDLFIFSDGEKDEQTSHAVSEVRDLISNITSFKSVTIVEHPKNVGLASSIISGVDHVVNKFGKVIVLEDDIVTSPFFLEYMNNALEKYQHSNNVWHISGWNYPIQDSKLEDTFFWGTMNCWGWATWEDRWKKFKKRPLELVNTWKKEDIYMFNLDGTYDFWSQVERNAEGSLDTWAVFWYATIFENQGLCLNPGTTLVKNIGHDGSGVNCGSDDVYVGEFGRYLPKLTDDLTVNTQAVELIKNYYRSLRPSLFQRVRSKIMRALK